MFLSNLFHKLYKKNNLLSEFLLSALPEGRERRKKIKFIRSKVLSKFNNKNLAGNNFKIPIYLRYVRSYN